MFGKIAGQPYIAQLICCPATGSYYIHYVYCLWLKAHTMHACKNIRPQVTEVFQKSEERAAAPSRALVNSYCRANPLYSLTICRRRICQSLITPFKSAYVRPAMTSSMTAFARQQSEHEWGTLVWEIRSVNHRFMEPGFRMPESLRHLEGNLREQLRSAIQRGKIEATLRFHGTGITPTSISVNEDLLNQLQATTAHIKARIPSCGPVDPMDILRWPGLVVEREQDTKIIEEKTLTLFSAALTSLQQQREREGLQLKQLIEDRLDAVSTIVANIRHDLPNILAAQADRIKTQFADLQLSVDPARLEQEIVLITQKADIHEEVDRLDTHVKEVLHTLNQKGQIGRRLDFLMQELNREANTICSKAIVTSTTFNAVELKVLIEQMREQIQNIE